MEMTYTDTESRRILPMRGGLKLTKDKAGRYWIWSEQLRHNLAMHHASEDDALRAALSFALWIIGEQDVRIKALQGFRDRFGSFLEKEGFTGGDEEG